MTARDCAICGTSFVPRRKPKARYCSTPCVAQAKRRPEIRVCGRCGHDYIVGTKCRRRRFCSMTCKTANYDPQRITERIHKTESCWLWTGDVGNSGYGAFIEHASRRTSPAHRSVYKILVGPIPVGLTLDHLCRNKLCVNPAHLEPVTLSENCRRGVAARRAQETTVTYRAVAR